MNNAFVINLDARLDNFQKVQEEFLPFGIHCERFSGITHAQGALGCTLSHLALIARAKKEGWPSVMVLEDDCMAREAMKEWSALSTFLMKEANRWDIFFGGAIFFHPLKKIDSSTEGFDLNVIEGIFPLATHFVIYNHSSYDRLLAWHDWSMPLEKKPAIDSFIQSCQLTTWISSPFLAWQKSHLSDVNHEISDCTASFVRAEKILNSFCRGETNNHEHH